VSQWFRDETEGDRIRARAAQIHRGTAAEFLDPAIVPGIVAQVYNTGTRRRLDQLTKAWWRQYSGRDENAVQLERIKEAILTRREQLDRRRSR
jgi:hypothetical protein